MENLELNYTKLIESIKLLALPFKEQKECFPDYSDVVFEVIDTFENSFRLLPILVENHYFSYGCIAWLLRLNNLININLNNSDLKDLNENKFESDPRWERIRKIASDILKLLNEPNEKPN